MAEAHHNLAPVLKADRATGLGMTGLTDLIGHRFADVTAGGQAREMPGNADCKAARAVGCVSPVNRRFKGHADVWEAPRVMLRHCKGFSASCDPARVLVAASGTVRLVGMGK